MINNHLATIFAVFALAGCGRPEPPPGYQGVLEHDERGLGFEVSGKLTQLEVVEGDQVIAGQVIARVDDTLQSQMVVLRQLEADTQTSQVTLLRAGTPGEDIRGMRAKVEAALAGEHLLEKNLARERHLLAGGASTQARVDEATASLERANAERRSLDQQLARLLHGARKEELDVANQRADAAWASETLESERLERFQLASPVDGTILNVNLKVGELVQPGSPVLQVANIHAPYAEVFVPQDQLGEVHLGTPASVRVDAFPDPLSGEVSHISNKTEFTPRYLFSESERHNLVVRVKVAIDDPKGQLHAGVPVFVEWGAPAHDNP